MKMFSPKQTYLVHFLFFLFCWTLPIKAIPMFENEREKSKTPPADTTLARRNADFNQPLDEQRRGDIFPSENNASLDHEMNIPSSNENGLSPTSAPSAADATYVPPPNDLPAPVVRNSKANGSIFDPTIIHQKASQQAPLHLPSPFAAKASEEPTELETLSAISFPSGGEKALSVLADRYREEGILPDVNDEQIVQAITGAATKHLESVAARIALPKETSPADADIIAFLDSLPAISFPSGGEKALSVLADRYRQEGILPDVKDERIVQAITGAATKHLESVAARIALLKETSPADTNLIVLLESYHKSFKGIVNTRDLSLILKSFKIATQPREQAGQYQERAAMLQEEGGPETLFKETSEIMLRLAEQDQTTLNHLLEEPPDFEQARRSNKFSPVWRQAAAASETVISYELKKAEAIARRNKPECSNFINACDYGNSAIKQFASEISALEKVVLAPTPELATIWQQTADAHQTARISLMQRAQAYAEGNRAEERRNNISAINAEEVASYFTSQAEALEKAFKAPAPEIAVAWRQVAESTLATSDYFLKMYAPENPNVDILRSAHWYARDAASCFKKQAEALEKAFAAPTAKIATAWQEAAKAHQEQGACRMQEIEAVRTNDEAEGNRLHFQIFTPARKRAELFTEKAESLERGEDYSESSCVIQ